MAQRNQTPNDNYSIGCLVLTIMIALVIGTLMGNMRGALKWLSQ